MKCISALVLAANLFPHMVAAAPLDADSFDAATRGRTVYFYSDGEAYGVEHYLGNRKVAWSRAGDTCLEGRWYPVGNQICFVYDGEPAPHCWVYYEEGGALRALFENRPGEMELVEGKAFDIPLSCTGPEVGA